MKLYDFGQDSEALHEMLEEIAAFADLQEQWVSVKHPYVLYILIHTGDHLGL